jgi:methionyl-tRNA formyltransferase
VAQARNLPVDKPAHLKTDESRVRLAEALPEVLVVAAYGLILPKSVLAIPLLGCLNVHASLLPRWRGAAPVQRAILAGDRETGIDIMKMEPGLDTGPVLLERRTPIGEQETAGELTTRLAEEGAAAIVQVLADLQAFEEKAQPESGVTYAAKIDKAEAILDWSETAEQLSRRIRAFNPAPGASTRLQGEPLKIWSATPVPGVSGVPGAVVGEWQGCPLLACGQDGLALTSMQSAGGRRLTGIEFLKGKPLPAGTRLG